jgi:hypothetical protein
MNDTSLLNQALVSMLIGGGGYAALRGMHDLSGASKPKPLDNEIELTLPSTRIPKEKMAEGPSLLEDMVEGAKPFALPVLAIGGGLYGGFRGASGIYNHFANKDIDNEKEQVKNDYLAALQRASTKVGSINTPNVDNFIGGLLDKIAEETGLLGYLGNTVGKGIGDAAHKTWEGAKNMGSGLMHDAAKSEPVGLVAGLASLLALGSGGATYYLANRMDQNKEDNNRKTTLPTEIRLNVQ